MRSLAKDLILAGLLLPGLLLWGLATVQAAAALGTRWSCTPLAQQTCRPGEGCSSEVPWLGETTLYGGLESYRIDYCLSANEAICFQGIFEQDVEGWPDWGTLGVAAVERLPLKRSYHGEHGFFGSFDVNARTLLVTTLSVLGETTVWLACTAEGS